MGIAFLLSALMMGTMMSVSSLFEGTGAEPDSEDPAVDNPHETHGTYGDDLLGGTDSETVEGFRGDDTIEGGISSSLYGGLGADHLTGHDDASLYGGWGDDTLFGSDNVFAHGDEGNDALVLSGHATGDGGAGDDTLILDGNATAAGGDGADSFLLHATDGSATQITDFNTATDKLMMELPNGPVDLELSSATVDGIPQQTITMHWTTQDATTGADVANQSSVVLKGISDFVPEKHLSFVDQITDPGTDGLGLVTPQFVPLDVAPADKLASGGVSSMVLSGNGIDTVTGATSGSEVVFLRGGNDTYLFSGAEHTVYGGDGNDKYYASGADLVPDVSGTYMSGAFYGGAGNDFARLGANMDGISRPGMSGEVHLYGGEGDDTLVGNICCDVSADLYGGAGNDHMVLSSGITADGGDGRDYYEVIVNTQSATDHGVATISLEKGASFDDGDIVQIYVAHDLTGDVSYTPVATDDGTGVTGVTISIGGTPVVFVENPGFDPATALQVNDERVSIRRDMDFNMAAAA